MPNPIPMALLVKAAENYRVHSTLTLGSLMGHEFRDAVGITEPQWRTFLSSSDLKVDDTTLKKLLVLAGPSVLHWHALSKLIDIQQEK